jgi:hypothetical protein
MASLLGRHAIQWKVNLAPAREFDVLLIRRISRKGACAMAAFFIQGGPVSGGQDHG